LQGCKENFKKNGKTMVKKTFIIEILEKLKYDKDEPDNDYSEDLELLKIIWEEKLLQKGMKFYNN
jgi:hypothetical protein